MFSTFRVCEALLVLCSSGVGAVAFAQSGLRVEMLSPHGLADDAGDVRVRIRIETQSPGEYRLRQRLVSAGGAELSDWDLRDVTVQQVWTEERTLRLPSFGGFTLEARLEQAAEGALLAETSQRMVRILPMPPRSEAERTQSFVGVNTHRWADWALFGRLGIHWARDYVWSWYGRGEGGTVTRQGENMSARLQNATAAGVLTLPCIQKTFVTKDATRWMDDGEEIARIFTRLGNHFPDQRWFQIGNEEESKFPGHAHDAGNYAQFIRHAKQGLRAAGRDQQIVLAGDVFMHPEVMRGVMARTEPDDFLASAIHIYTGTAPPELARRDSNVGGDTRAADAYVLDRLRDYVRLLGGRGHEVWITETGWDVTFGPAVGERRQAAWLPRFYLLSRWLGVKKVFWFYDRDYEGTTRFASSGLLDLNRHLRPSAATLAAMSALIVGTESAGSVDLGENVWALLWQKPDGGGIATVWSLAEEAPLPAILAQAQQRLDQFGNPMPPDAPLRDEVAYFHFESWPAGWEGQRHVELLSHRRLEASAGGSFHVEVSRVEGVSWRLHQEDLSWTLEAVPEGDRHLFRVRVPDALQSGEHALTLEAAGEGWVRRWPLHLEVKPVLDIPSLAYRPGVELELPIRSFDGRAVALRVQAEGGLDRISPEVLQVKGDTPVSLRLTPSADSRGVIPFAVLMDSGGKQTVHLRPMEVWVPKGNPGVAAAPQDWPEALRWPSGWFAQNRLEPDLGLAWSAEGLWIAVSFEAGELHNLDPEWFWTAQILEIFVQPSAEGGEGWTEDVRQFWLQPVLRDGVWQTLAGEWRKRGRPDAQNIYGHPEIQTGLRHENGRLTMSAFLPVSVLGKPPAAGDRWRAALAVQHGLPAQMNLRAAWPISKGGGLLDGPHRWGILRYED